MILLSVFDIVLILFILIGFWKNLFTAFAISVMGFVCLGVTFLFLIIGFDISAGFVAHYVWVFFSCSALWHGVRTVVAMRKERIHG
jgi:hypothetical protein